MENAIRITVPIEVLGTVDEVMQRYALSYDLVASKTDKSGGLFNLTYNVRLRDEEKEEEFISVLASKSKQRVWLED